jgi:hypothetical protein
MKPLFSFLVLFLGLNMSFAQHPNPGYWQQHVDYTMDVEVDVNSFKYWGTQELVYTNHSPDVLEKVYYHLYFNAFQPGSQMDIRSRSIADPDKRVGDRILGLQENEIGKLNITSLSQNNQPLTYKEEGTLASVSLSKPLQPGESTTLSMRFEGQIPKQIRRSGRDNKEGVSLSMTQWFPKMAEYDHEGWHTDPYIGREFHGVWGNYRVSLTLDKTYVVGGTGYLQNPQEVGHGYENPNEVVKLPKGDRLRWEFYAPNVHDFAWAADPDFVHDTVEGPNGVTLHFLYNDDEKIKENWQKLQEDSVALLDFFNKNIGAYPWKQYSIIQGGDGGMEYAMCTLITGNRSYPSLLGVTAHEMAHAWFQHILATNEAKHEWMDEGFTTFISTIIENKLLNIEKNNPWEDSYRSYRYLANSGKEQPQTTHADRYKYNGAYGASAYSKGAIFLAQLGYIIGMDKAMETVRKYYADFKFTHPTPNDIKRTAEKVSGFRLGWYLTDWTQTTNTIDYAIEIEKKKKKTLVLLKRIGLMPMPIDILVVYKDDSQESFYIPLQMMLGEKENPYPSIKRTVLEDWFWGSPSYSFEISKDPKTISSISIDPSGLMADVDMSNNFVEIE